VPKSKTPEPELPRYPVEGQPQHVGEDVARTLPRIGGSPPGADADRLPRLGGSPPDGQADDKEPNK
jgi:hypothetical protein